MEPAAKVIQAEWNSCSQSTRQTSLSWGVSWRPPGFVPAGQSTYGDVGDVKLYTDGLSAFSVFLRPMTESVTAKGKAQRGATVAYMHQQMINDKPYTITVVGEVPARTAQRIATSVVIKPKPVTDDALSKVEAPVADDASSAVPSEPDVTAEAAKGETK